MAAILSRPQCVITTTKHSECAYFVGYTLRHVDQRTLLLTWISFNPIIDKWLHQYKVYDEIGKSVPIGTAFEVC